MSSLRSQLIRLAHQNPDLRPQILPLLKEAETKTAALPENVVDTDFLKRHVRNVYNGIGHAVDVAERTGTVDPQAVADGVKALNLFAKVLEEQAQAAVVAHATLKSLAQTAAFHALQLRANPSKQDVQAAYSWILDV